MIKRFNKIYNQQFEINKILIDMDKLLDSRRQRDEPHQRLGTISPQKYGKGAYCDMTYTPSKLADNVLFREVSNLKKIEEESTRTRQYEAQNQILVDQVNYLKKERDGISTSLNGIIEMYKGIIADMESKNDQRLKQSQKRWSEEIQKYIKDKQEEARYFQSEKELLEERIEALEAEGQALKDQLANFSQDKTSIFNQLELSKAENNHLKEKYNESLRKAQEDKQRAKDEYDQLKREMLHAEVQAKNKMNEQLHKKQLEIDALERSHRAELEMVQTTRKNELILKNQQVKELARAFENESNRLKDILSVKDRMIENLSIENNKEKNRILKMTQEYETQINHLSHEKNRLIDEIQYLGKDNQILTKDKMAVTGDLQKQNIGLRELLIQSSGQLDRCKKEFLSLANENTMLLSKLKSAEEEARTWRDSYYLNKTRPY